MRPLARAPPDRHPFAAGRVAWRPRTPEALHQAPGARAPTTATWVERWRAPWATGRTHQIRPAPGRARASRARSRRVRARGAVAAQCQARDHARAAPPRAACLDARHPAIRLQAGACREARPRRHDLPSRDRHLRSATPLIACRPGCGRARARREWGHARGHRHRQTPGHAVRRALRHNLGFAVVTCPGEPAQGTYASATMRWRWSGRYAGLLGAAAVRGEVLLMKPSRPT